VNDEPDGAVGERLLGDGVTAFTGLEGGLLDGVGLEEAIELLLPAPGLVEVVEPDAAVGGVEDDGVEPAGEADEDPGGLPLEEPGGGVLKIR
jgi:hypothetical protein